MNKTSNGKGKRQLRVQRMVRPTGVKTHHFMLGVKTNGTRKSAELAVLASFAGRKPDGCEFYLRDMRKEEWMAGARSGMETALELAARSIENLRKTCGVTSGPNAELQRPREAGSVARSGSPAKREARPQQPEVPQSPAERGIAERIHGGAGLSKPSGTPTPLDGASC